MADENKEEQGDENKEEQGEENNEVEATVQRIRHLEEIEAMSQQILEEERILKQNNKEEQEKENKEDKRKRRNQIKKQKRAAKISQSDSAGGEDDPPKLLAHDVDPPLTMKADGAQAWDAGWDANSGEEEWIDFSETKKHPSYSAGAGGGDDDVDPPLTMKNVDNAGQPMPGEEQEDTEEEEKDKGNKVLRLFPNIEKLQRDSAGAGGGGDPPKLAAHDVGPPMIVKNVDNAGQPMPGEENEDTEEEEKDKDKKVLRLFPYIEKLQRDSAGAGGGGDPPKLAAHDVGPPMIVKGFKTTVSNHFYNGVVTVGYPNDNQLRNMEDVLLLEVLPRSFIPCHNLLEDQLEHIESLGERNPQFLFPKEVVNCEIKKGTVSKFFVTEEMLTVEEYFEDQLQKYLKTNGWEVRTFVNMPKLDRLGKLCDWWKYISSRFISIFRDLIQALLYYYHTIAKPIGDLEKNVFVTKRHSKVRVLPSMNNSNTFDDDLSSLSKMMRRSVLPAFLAEVEVNVEQVVSPALRLFLDFVSKNKGAASQSGIISLCSMIDHPFMWSSMDRIRFIKKMYNKCKKDHATYNLLEKKLRNLFLHDANGHWKDQVVHPVLVEILMKPLKPNSKVKEYADYADIIRFYNAVYSHYNEKEYNTVRPKDLDDDEIDEILTSEFPKLCVWVKTIVLNDLTHNLKKLPSTEMLPTLEDLFSFKH